MFGARHRGIEIPDERNIQKCQHKQATTLVMHTADVTRADLVSNFFLQQKNVTLSVIMVRVTPA
jgi:hypothetical protein